VLLSLEGNQDIELKLHKDENPGFVAKIHFWRQMTSTIPFPEFRPSRVFFGHADFVYGSVDIFRHYSQEKLFTNNSYSNSGWGFRKAVLKVSHISLRITRFFINFFEPTIKTSSIYQKLKKVHFGIILIY